MADKETSVRALTGTRQLSTMLPSCIVTQKIDQSGYEGDLNGWRTYNSNCVYYETFIDLSAHELDSLTFVPTGGLVQEPGVMLNTDPSVNGHYVLDIITSERLDIPTVISDLQLSNAPGMSASPYDFTSIIMGTMRVMTKDSSFAASFPNALIPLTSQTFGSASPTAASKLWCYKIVLFLVDPPQPTTLLSIPASRFILPGMVIQEKELAYMMRLKRSYELAPSVD